MTTNLERWRYFYKDIESPDLFIDWTFYCTISAALQRRVCLDQVPHLAIGRPLYPNLYVIFIAPPGIGKSTAAYGSVDIFKSFGGFDSLETLDKRLIKVAPSSLTLEQLYRYLNVNHTMHTLDPKYVVPNPKGKALTKYMSSPLAFFATEELGTLFQENTSDLVKFITEGYDCGDFHRETKTQGVDFIKHMCLMLLGCATPDWITEVSKNGLLKQGFAARTIFVWGDKKRHIRRKYTYSADQLKELGEFKKHLLALTKVYGPLTESPEADEWFTKWYEDGGEINRLNKDRRLVDYYARKKVHMTKVGMVMHFADKTDLTIGIEDYQNALAFLTLTEKDMHMALLGTSSDNPAYMIAAKIEERLNEKLKLPDGHEIWTPEGELLMHTWEHCTNGRATFDEAIKYLQDTKKIQVQPSNGKPCYRIFKNKKNS